MRRCMVVLLVDALGFELLQRTPELGSRFPHRRRLETILGFSAGALPTLFTGRMPCEHGRWLMYRRAGTASAGDRHPTPFAGFGALALLPERLRQSGMVSRRLTRRVAERGVRGYFHLYEVPRALLPAFDLPEQENVFAPGGLPVDSLWDSLQRRGVRWRGWNWRTPETRNLAELLDAIGSGEAMLFCYTAELDARLHAEGSHGPGVQAQMARYLAFVDEARRVAAGCGVDLWLYLLSDHGMVDVRATVDVIGALRPIRSAWPRDYLAFFDSTMARFWWHRPGARAAVREALAALPGGRWLDPAELSRQGASFPEHDYGEDLWLADPGVLIVPSFMGREPVAAMHGYDPAHPGMAATLLSTRPLPAGVTHLRDVRGFLEAELDALAEAA